MFKASSYELPFSLIFTRQPNAQNSGQIRIASILIDRKTQK
uniref:Uncharacterized protein n=1 Tax=Anguilla anguilla TaxID=7936 RepID=A0A0E9XA75_ANGAN